MFKVVVVSVVLSFLIVTGGLYSNDQLPLVEFMDLADLYYQQKFEDENIHTPIQERYLSRMQDICNVISEDGFQDRFDQLMEHASRVIYSRRVLLGELYKRLDTMILQQLHQQEDDNFLADRHQQILQWQRDNIAGNDLYFHRLRVFLVLEGTTLTYHNLAGEELVFTVEKKHIQEVEKGFYAGHKCLQVRIGDGLLRWLTYYRIEDLHCLGKIPEFNS